MFFNFHELKTISGAVLLAQSGFLLSYHKWRPPRQATVYLTL